MTTAVLCEDMEDRTSRTDDARGLPGQNLTMRPAKPAKIENYIICTMMENDREMSNILELIQKERDRIRAKRGVNDTEPERYLSILVKEVGEAAKAINDWRENKGYIRDAMDEMIQVCAVAIDMCESLERREEDDVELMLNTWGKEWVDRFEKELEDEYEKGEYCGKYTCYRRGLKGFELSYEFVSSDDHSKDLLYIINLKKIERDKTSSSSKANEVIASVRRGLFGENEDVEE